MTYQEFLTRKVEKLAEKHDLLFLEQKDWANTGWWIIKDDEGKTQAKLYFNFQSGYCTVNEGRGNIFPGVYCNYGNDADEKKLIKFIEDKFSKDLDLDTRLSNATERSELTDTGVTGKDDVVKE